MDWRRAGLSEWQQTLEGASVPKKRRVDFGAFALARSTLTALRFVRASMPAGEQALTALRFVRASMLAGEQALTTLRFASLRARASNLARDAYCAPLRARLDHFFAPRFLHLVGYHSAVRILFGFVLGWAGILGAQPPPPTAPAPAAPAPASAAPAPPGAVKATGVSTPGVRIPMARLKPEAVFDIPGSPDWMAIGDAFWISNSPKNTVTRVDPKTNKIVDTITTGKKPCSGLAIGFGSLWVPNCGDKNVVRLDLVTGKITATLPIPVADSEGAIATGAGSVWILTDKQGTLARVDPDTNKIVAEIYVPAGSFCVVFGDDAVWVTSTQRDVLTRIDPHTNLVTASIAVGKAPRFLAVGLGAVWVLNQGDGKVTRVDAKTNQVVATIEVGVPGEGGDIAVGEGSVWVTAFEFPISRIDPAANKVVQQFTGVGGDAIRVGLGSVWLTDLKNGKLMRFDPKRIEATQPE